MNADTLNTPAERTPCGCCGGARKVLTAIGTLRPCSRCSYEAYEAWSGLHYPPAAQEGKAQ